MDDAGAALSVPDALGVSAAALDDADRRCDCHLGFAVLTGRTVDAGVINSTFLAGIVVCEKDLDVMRLLPDAPVVRTAAALLHAAHRRTAPLEVDMVTAWRYATAR